MCPARNRLTILPLTTVNVLEIVHQDGDKGQGVGGERTLSFFGMSRIKTVPKENIVHSLKSLSFIF